MQLIVLILLYLGIVSSPDQVDNSIIQDNQEQIESVMNDGIVINTIVSE
ncbi:MAG: hypothetical protein H6581_15745 [Bacteroidia bacterium]|nr:hypothetical protein [Bacteroidia bacterium]